MASKITLTVISSGVVGEFLGLASGINLLFRNDAGFGHVPVRSNTIDQATDIVNIFERDYNGSRIFEVVQTQNVIEIKHPDDDYFNSVVSNVSFITFTTENTVETQLANLTVSVGESNTNPCEFVTATLTFDLEITNLVVGWFGVSQETAATFTSGTFQIPRGVVSFYISYTDTDGDTKTVSGNSVPDIFEITGISVIRNISNSQAIIGVNVIAGQEQYAIVSIDDINNPPATTFPDVSGTVNTFTGLIPGSYLAMAKDAFGCVRQQTFEVTETQTNIRVPFFSFVSPVNDFPFFLYNEPSEGTNRNQDNRLANEVPLRNQRQQFFEHPIYENARGVIQFKSSAEINEAFVVDCDGNQIALDVVQRSDFIEADLILDAKLSQSNGVVRVRFTTGNIYDTQGNVTGTHAYNNSLPLQYEVNTQIFIEGVGSGIITSIDDNNDGNTYAITSIQPNGTLPTEAIVTALYTIEPYEIYEFEHSPLLSPTEVYALVINCYNPNSINTNSNVWRTHPIRKFKESEIEDYQFMKYYAANYHEINYNWGIKHQRYIKWEHLPYPITPAAEIESYQTDTGVNKIDFMGKRLYKHTFEKMPNEVALSLAEAFNFSDVIVIDQKGYVSEQAADLQNVGTLEARVSLDLTANRVYDDITSNVVSNNINVNSFYPIVP